MLRSFKQWTKAMVVIAALAFFGIAQEAQATLVTCSGTVTRIASWGVGYIDVVHTGMHSSNQMRLDPSANETNRGRVFSALLAAYLSGRTVEMQIDVTVGSTSCGSISDASAGMNTSIIKYVWLK